MSLNLEDYVPPIQSQGLNTNTNTSLGGTLTVTGASTFTGAQTFNGAATFNSNITFATAPTFTGGQLANVVSATTSATLTIAQSGSVVVFNSTTGVILTLPPPTTGVNYQFVVAKTPAASSHGIVTNTGSVFLQGGVVSQGTTTAATASTFFAADGTTHIAMRMNGTTTGGGTGGTNVYVVCQNSTQWNVTGQNATSGLVSTPFLIS